MHQQPQANSPVPMQLQQPAAQQHMMASQAMVAMNPEPEATRNLMVNYIPTTMDEEQLRHYFIPYGPIETVKIVYDRETRQSRGYGFVKYQYATSAQQAMAQLNGLNVMNKRLKVALAAAGHQRQRHSYPQAQQPQPQQVQPPPPPQQQQTGYAATQQSAYAPAPYMGQYGVQQPMVPMYSQYMMQPQQQYQQQYAGAQQGAPQYQYQQAAVQQ